MWPKSRATAISAASPDGARVFRRRQPRTTLQNAREFLYPRRGFRRAFSYLVHRLRRLPDQPHRIARGIFAGILVSFTPTFGLHLLLAALLAWMIRGNIVAALIGTFIGNPITFPFIATASVGLGHWLLGVDAPLSALYIVVAFSDAGGEFWQNVQAMFSSAPTEWHRLSRFYQTVYRPYVVGGVLLGTAAGLAGYAAALPLIHTWQRFRTARRDARSALVAASRQPSADPASGGDGGAGSG